MTLHVYTARISSRDPDRFDITRKSGGKEGAVFAPSWDILRPAIEARKSGDPRAEFDAWKVYVPRYRAEMRQSYRAHRHAWDALTRRSRVVLVCYCADPCRCHRTLLGRFILPKLGAVYGGEVS